MAEARRGLGYAVLAAVAATCGFLGWEWQAHRHSSGDLQAVTAATPADLPAASGVAASVPVDPPEAAEPAHSAIPDTVPDLTLPDTNGQQKSLRDYLGRPLIINFWATWCGPCRHALPGLKQIQSVYGGDQLEIISVSEDDDEDAWHNFVAQNEMTWTQRLDSGHQMMRQYGASALPTYVLIGKDGSVVNQYVGDDPDVPIIERIGPDLKKSLE